MLLKADVKLATDAFHDVVTATGLAEMGVRLSSGSEPAGANAMGAASVGAGKAANCPYLRHAASMQSPVSANLAPHCK